ncbi:Mitochondrial inner membrane protein oxa1-1 [Colletotrichum plurivorum]|uniref:Mitochondrial inner membrane protein oxa1-1 n=1 Tax=Colletotrichum plurivorum TaxID=2175906 RepID=A0A8H6U4S6_9PEZI|nr:Mitochondrial inner membrane protein oxa1-1 [Colletotrichum plurivorum]
MTSMRATRLVLGPRSPFHASLRPKLGAANQRFTQATAVPRRFFVGSVGAAADGAVQICESVLLGLGSGLGWTFAIPTAALMVACLRLPIRKHTEMIMLRQADTMPLLTAWKRQIGYSSHQQVKQVWNEQKRIFRERGIQSWKVTAPPLLTLPVWLAVSEALRRLCGYGSGMLSLIIPEASKTKTPDPNDAFSVIDQAVAALSPVDAASAVDTLSNSAQSAASAIDMGVYSQSGQLIIDWAAADPTGYTLPAMLCITMLWGSLPLDKPTRELVFNAQSCED